MDTVTSLRRITVLGLDGLTLNLIEPWVRAGQLPAFARLLEQGASGVLHSTRPPMSAQAWTTIVTGRNLARHGIVDFAARPPGAYRLEYLNAQNRAGPAVWDMLSEAGYRVAVVNVPITYPPAPVNGVLMAGMDAPSVDTPFIYPPELREPLLARFPAYQIEARPFGALHGAHRDHGAMLRDVLGIEETRFDLLRDLYESQSPAFSMVVFRSADLIQHWFWKQMDADHPQHDPDDSAHRDAILSAYQQLDRFVGWHLDRVSAGDVLVVVSDHGFSPVGDRVVCLNAWLEEQGWLSVGAGVAQRSGLRSFWRAWMLARRTVPPAMKAWLLKRFPRVRERIPSAAAFSGIDWSRTRAFAFETRGVIYINVKGREPNGVVELGAEYERLRDEIIERLSAWRDPVSGDPLVARVYRREELYEGALIEWVPDLIVEWAGRYQPNLGYRVVSTRPDAVSVLTPSELRSAFRPNATHDVDGIFAIVGDMIRPGRLAPQALVDITPTILYLAGTPIPRNMDGHVIREAIAPDFLRAHPAEFAEPVAVEGPVQQAGYDERDREEIAERLRGLGYIE